MSTMFDLLFAIAALAFVACIVWLHWRALRDGAFHDVLLFLTGVSILSYIVTRWDRAKRPFLGMIGSGLVFACVAILSSGISGSSQDVPADTPADSPAVDPDSEQKDQD